MNRNRHLSRANYPKRVQPHRTVYDATKPKKKKRSMLSRALRKVFRRNK